MIDLDPLLHDVSGLTPVLIGVVAAAGLVVAVAPSSVPLISVATGLVANQRVLEQGSSKCGALVLAAGFVLGIATVDALLGARRALDSRAWPARRTPTTGGL